MSMHTLLLLTSAASLLVAALAAPMGKLTYPRTVCTGTIFPDFKDFSFRSTNPFEAYGTCNEGPVARKLERVCVTPATQRRTAQTKTTTMDIGYFIEHLTGVDVARSKSDNIVKPGFTFDKCGIYNIRFVVRGDRKCDNLKEEYHQRRTIREEVLTKKIDDVEVQCDKAVKLNTEYTTSCGNTYTPDRLVQLCTGSGASMKCEKAASEHYTIEAGEFKAKTCGVFKVTDTVKGKFKGCLPEVGKSFITFITVKAGINKIDGKDFKATQDLKCKSGVILPGFTATCGPAPAVSRVISFKPTCADDTCTTSGKEFKPTKENTDYTFDEATRTFKPLKCGVYKVDVTVTSFCKEPLTETYTFTTTPTSPPTPKPFEQPETYFCNANYSLPTYSSSCDDSAVITKYTAARCAKDKAACTKDADFGDAVAFEGSFFPSGCGTYKIVTSTKQCGDAGLSKQGEILATVTDNVQAVAEPSASLCPGDDFKIPVYTSSCSGVDAPVKSVVVTAKGKTDPLGASDGVTVSDDKRVVKITSCGEYTIKVVAGECSQGDFAYAVNVDDNEPLFKGDCSAGFTYTTKCKKTAVKIASKDVTIGFNTVAGKLDQCALVYTIGGASNACNVVGSLVQNIEICDKVALGGDGVSAGSVLNVFASKGSCQLTVA